MSLISNYPGNYRFLFGALGLLLSWGTASAQTGAGESQTSTPRVPLLCYCRDGIIFITDDQGRNPYAVVTKGATDACLAPGGKVVAFTLNAPDNGPPHRRIATASVESREVSVLSAVPGNNSYKPLWSPDGKQIAFQFLQKKEWQIGVVSADNTGFRVISGGIKPDRPGGLTGAFWARDGQSFFAYDFDNIYQIGTTGSLLSVRSNAFLFENTELSSGHGFSRGPGGESVLYTALVPDKANEEGYPLSRVFLVDFQKGSRRCVSPDGTSCWEPAWHPDGKSWYACKAGRNAGIYRFPLTQGRPQLVVPGASSPTLAHGAALPGIPSMDPGEKVKKKPGGR